MKFKNIPITSWDIYEPENPEKNIGHSIKIPNHCMDEMLYSITGYEPMCIEIMSIVDSPLAKANCIVSGNIEIGNDEIVVVPFWALSKLGIEQFSLVSIENVSNVRKAGYIKVRADVSDYAYWDGIKETLETEFSKINCISVGNPVNIFGIEFYVVELHDVEGIRMLDGSLFNTDIEIDFDTPLDIAEQEHSQILELARIEEEKRRQEEEMEAAKKQQEIEDREQEREEYLRKNPHFRGNGFTISGQTGSDKPREITREERAKMFERLFEQQKQQKEREQSS